MTEPQLDFVLECYAADHPREYTFTRLGVTPPAPPSTATANWFNVLRGRALEQFMSGRINHAVLKARKARAAVFGVRGKGKDTIVLPPDKEKT